MRASSSSSLVRAAALLSAAGAAAAATADFPYIDFDGLGQVAISGSFAGVQVWNQNVSTLNSGGAFQADAGSLLSLSPSGQLAKVGSTGEGGAIRAICQRSNAPNSTVFVGGAFDQINGSSVSNIAAYDPASRTWSNLAGGLDGVVEALYCDEEHGQLVAGGSFARPRSPPADVADRFLGGVASWSYADSSWSPLVFGGVNGTVDTITQGSNSSNIRLLGAFDTQFSSAPGTNGSASGTNTSASSLTIAMAPLPLGQSEFQGGPVSSNRDYANPAQILCPRGDDGPNNTFLFADNAPGRLTLRTFRSLSARALRLANTFIDGRGTRTFSVVSIPDNQVLTMVYVDPATGQNVTCSDRCTLAHDANIPYQDFLFVDLPEASTQTGVRELTGIQLTVSEWYGPGAGLHSLSLLSEGAFAYAYGGYNRGRCTSSQPGVNSTDSTTTSEGGWYQTNTVIGGASAPILAYQDSYSNLAQAVSSVSLRWDVDAHYNGNYSAYLYVPGCTAAGQCGQRTDVLVTTNAQANVAGSQIRVSQAVQDDTKVLVYSGPVDRTSDTFKPSIVLTIPQDASRPTRGNNFIVVADKVSLYLRSSPDLLQMVQARGFGMLEYNVFDTEGLPLANGTQVLSNNSLNAFSNFGTTLLAAGVNRTEGHALTSAASLLSTTFVGGNFTSRTTNIAQDGFANLVSYTDASGGSNYTRLPGGGLNGPVSSLAVISERLFVGGNFSATADNATQLSNLAEYDVRANAWKAISGAPDGAVLTLAVFRNSSLLVTGAFESRNKGADSAAGFAVWDTKSNNWVPQDGLLIGSIDSVSAPSTADGLTYMGGAVTGLSTSSAAGAARLNAPEQEGGAPTIEPLNYSFRRQDQAAAVSSARESFNLLALRASARRLAERVMSGEDELSRRRVHTARALSSGAVSSGSLSGRSGGGLTRWFSSSLLSRGDEQASGARTSLTRRADAMEPPSLATNGDEDVLASAFWQRGDDDFVFVVGGNFTTSEGIVNLGWYDYKTSELNSFPQLPSSSNLTVIRALYVDGNQLYAGGDGGLQMFDFSSMKWLSDAATLSVEGGATVLSVSDIDHRPDSSTIVVAGTFDNAGSLPCANICAWDTQTRRWSQLGAGVRDGQISTIDFGGSKANTVVVGGSMTINGAEASLATYDLDRQVWTALGSVGSGDGQVPGPATALSVDDLSLNSIFVAGRTTDGQQPYLAKWNGQSFTRLAPDELLSDTGIAQLSFVGITRAHPSNDVLENNRLLVVSGALSMRDYGNVSTALYDGSSWTPFLIATAYGGGLGAIRAFTRSTEVLSFPNLHHLAVGIVILISIAIGLGIVFLLVLLGLLWALLRRKERRGVEVPISPSDDTLGAAGEKKQPAELLATLNAATEGAMGGHGAQDRGVDDGAQMAGVGAAGAGAGAAGFAAAAAAAASTSHGHGPESSAHHGGVGSTTLDHSDPSTAYHSERTGQTQYYSGDDSGAAVGPTPGAAAVGMAYGGMDDEEREGIEAHARYSFEATHPSEVSMRAGDTIFVLDDGDESWWLIARLDGQTGVVPATYVL